MSGDPPRLVDRGLDLLAPDVLTAAERDAFRASYADRHAAGDPSYVLPAYELWLELRPEVLKRFRMQARHSSGAPERPDMPFSVLAFLYHYCVHGFEPGILYQIKHAQHAGATRAEVLDTIALAFVHAGPQGLHSVATSALEHLRSYEEPDGAGLGWPESWAFDPGAFAAGLDYSHPQLLAGELDLVRDWYRRVAGEVPAHVELLGRYRPDLLKAQRGRFEHALTQCPKQYAPYLMTYFEVTRGFGPGIREGVLLGRGFGMTRDEILDAIGWAMVYGGPAAISIAADAVGDVLDHWD